MKRSSFFRVFPDVVTHSCDDANFMGISSLPNEVQLSTPLPQDMVDSPPLATIPPPVHTEFPTPEIAATPEVNAHIVPSG